MGFVYFHTENSSWAGAASLALLSYWVLLFSGEDLWDCLEQVKAALCKQPLQLSEEESPPFPEVNCSGV